MVFCLAPEELASRRVFGRFSFSQEQASHHVGGYATQDGLKQAQEPFEFNYQLDRHCSKTIVSVINPFYKFNYQLDRHCSKTRMATSWRESSNTDATSDKAGYVGAACYTCRLYRERGSSMYLALGAYGLAILIPFLLYVVGRVIVEIYLAIWRWRHM